MYPAGLLPVFSLLKTHSLYPVAPGTAFQLAVKEVVVTLVAARTTGLAGLVFTVITLLGADSPLAKTARTLYS